MDSVEKVLEALRAHGAQGEVRTLTEAVPTAAAAAEQLGCEPGAIANSLVFVAPGDDPEPVLILTSGAHRVDTKRVAALLGVPKLKRATADQVEAATGQQIGGCAPVGHPSPLRTVVDTWLGKYGTVWAGGGDEFTMIATSLDELAAMTGGTVADVGD